MASPITDGADVTRVAYLFAGTYGDFVQILPTLREMDRRFPQADLFLAAPKALYLAFRSELPTRVQRAKPIHLLLWAIFPVEALMTNAVGVYRVRFDFAARFCARISLGFRYPGEPPRSAYSFTLELPPPPANFGRENLRLINSAASFFAFDLSQQSETQVPESVAKRAGSGRRVLFHIGSAGLQKDFGTNTYLRIINTVLNQLPIHAVEIYHGPGEMAVAQTLRGMHPGMTVRILPMADFIAEVRRHEGTLLCFNSFMAHLCHYLGKPALVIHRDAVPYGYDCAPLHEQIILTGQDGYTVPVLRPYLGQDRIEADPLNLP